MVDEPEKKFVFPMMPIRAWWGLRRQFFKSVPSDVDSAYISTCLGFDLKSAKNVLPDLVRMNIIDEAGKTLERAYKWRDDDQYPALCEELRKELFPTSLTDNLSGKDVDEERVKRWFMQNAKVGESAARRMTNIYVLLCKADPSEGKETEAVPAPRTPKTVAASSEPTAPKRPVLHKRSEAVPPPIGLTSPVKNGPSIHMDIQIHISPDSTPEQIDKIFSCLAKYFQKKGEVDDDPPGDI